MKKIIILIMISLVGNIIFAQNRIDAEKLVNEGIAYHDKGDYEGAITKYNKALELDKDNLLALAEKAFSLISLEKYDEVIKCCELAIEKHSMDEGLKNVYVTYGNALDGLKKTDKSLEVYNAGIKVFPDYYQLHFNKGITLYSIKKYDEAILCFQQAIMINPKHGSSHNAIARILNMKHKRIPALLTFSRFLILEPSSKRGIENLENVKLIMGGNAEKTGKNSVTINISPDMLGDTTADGKPKENSFTSTDLILAMSSAMDFDKKNKKKTEVQKFISKFETVCASLSETQDKNSGFYWDYYVPYFIEMKNNNLIETFAYIIYSSSEDKDVAKWIKAHGDDITRFYDWSKKFPWKKS